LSVTVIIPALNEEESIGQVLAALPSGVTDEIIVVDGGSSDGTAAIGRAGVPTGVRPCLCGWRRRCPGRCRPVPRR
jgi:hypothetical protein